MSAPLVVNTTDGTCWTRREGTRGGEALYAPEKCGQCPQFVMATYAELAEHGIAGSADVLPMPVGPEPQAGDRRTAAEVRLEQYGDERRTYGTGSEKALHQIALDLRGELERLRGRVAELEAAQGTVFRASHDSIVMGHYTTRQAAMDHVHATLANEEGGDVTARVIWRADDPEVDEPTWECWLFDAEMADDEPTGYVVTPVEVASAYDEEAAE